MAMTGTVKFFNGERGYGFIKPDDGGRDVFVHITAVERAGLKDLDRRTAHHFRSRAGQEGQGPEGGQSGDFVVSCRSTCLADADDAPNRLIRSRWRAPMRPSKKIPAASGREVVVRYFLV